MIGKNARLDNGALIFEAGRTYPFFNGNRMQLQDRSLRELLRELMLIRGHNKTWLPNENQATYLLQAEGGLVLMAFERFLRVLLGAEATDKDTLQPLLEKATSARLRLLVIDTNPGFTREDCIKQVADVRNSILHANHEQAARNAKVGSVHEYFFNVFASEVERLYQILAQFIEQHDPALADSMKQAPDRRLQ